MARRFSSTVSFENGGSAGDSQWRRAGGNRERGDSRRGGKLRHRV
jgi:hypothetical protein